MNDKTRSRLTLEVDYPDGTCTYSIGVSNWDLHIDQVAEEMIRPLLLAAGFHEDNVNSILVNEDECNG